MSLETMGVNFGHGESNESESKLEQARNTMLADGASVKTALYESEGAGVVSHDTSEKIAEQWNMLVTEHTDAVLSCNGKSEEEAREILRPLVQSLQ
jgi:hypothetical protein